MVQIKQEVSRIRGPNLTIDCPNCLGQGIPAISYDELTKEKLYGLFSIHEVNSTWVTCSRCGTKLRSSYNAASLEGLTAANLGSVLSVDAGFVRKAVSLIAICLAILPIFGIVPAAISLAMNWRLRSWPRSLSLFALIGAISIPVLMICVGLILHIIGV